MHEEEYINITNDGGLKKKIINKGHGEKPDEGSRVFISYLERNKNDKTTNNQNKIKIVFKIGENRVIKGWEIGIKTMKIWEKSIFILNPEYSDILLKSPNLKSKIDKIYEIELLKIEQAVKTIYTQRVFKRGLSEKKLNNYNKEKISINEIRNNIKKIPHGEFSKKKYGDMPLKYRTERNKVSQSLDKKIGNKNIIRINRKYVFKTFKNLIMKTEAPICNKCFRLVYISFDFIKNYISTKCPYCNKFDIYKYDSFIEKLKRDKNPLKCFLYSENIFYLIENSKDNFFVICHKCFKKSDYKDYKKKFDLKELINHNLSLYEKNKNLDELKNLDNQIINNKVNINKDLIIFEKYIKSLILIESIIKNTLLSLRKVAEEKIIKLKKEVKIKKKIIEYFQHYNHYIIGNNINSLLSTLLDFEQLNLSNDKKYNIKESYDIAKSFLKCEKYIIFENINKPINFFDEFIITKSFLNPNNFIQNKEQPKEEIFDLSHLNVININFETEENIIYNILADYCFAEKITPIIFNYNIKQKHLYEQEIFLYNINRDKYIYYGIYDINYKIINKESLVKLYDEKIDDFKILCLNYGLDLFLICQTTNDEIIYFYLNNFRNNLNTKKYQILDENYNNLEIINNEICVCLKGKQKLILVSKNYKKELNFSDEISDINIAPNGTIYENINNNLNFNNNNMLHNNNMNINMNNMFNNNMNALNIFNNNNNINMNNNFMNNNNMNNIFMNNNLNMNNMNNNFMNNNLNMDSMNNNLINNNNFFMNDMNNNFMNNNIFMNNINNDMNMHNMFMNNNNMNMNMNNMIINMFMNMLNNMNLINLNVDMINEKFENDKKGIKSFFRQITLNDYYIMKN